MDGESTERRLDPTEVSAVLAAHGFGADRTQANALILALTEPLRVVWGNASAARLLGTRDGTAMAARLFAGRGRDGLAHVLPRLVAGAGARFERLRLFEGFRSRTVSASLSLVRLSDGEEVIVVAMPTAAAEPGDQSGFGVDVLDHPTAAADVPPAVEPAPAQPQNAEPEPEPGTEGAADWMSPSPTTPLGHRRFLWQTDAAHLLTGLTDAVPELETIDEEAGRSLPLPDLLASSGVEGREAFAAVMATQASFSGLRVLWPLTGGTGTVPVVLGAVPMKGEGGLFAGFRGFGVVDFAKAMVHDRSAQPAAPAGESAPPPVPEGEPEAAPDLALVAERPAAEPPPDSVVDRIDRPRYATGVRASFSSAKVVALRPYKMLTETIPAAMAPQPPARRQDDVPAPSDEGGEGPDLSNLSSVEQFNFDEIARALKAATDGADVVSGAGTPVPDDAAAILAALPVALLVDCKGRTVYANAPFLAMTGYASARALDNAGGRPHLLGGLDAAQVAGIDQDRSFPLVDASGGIVSVEGRLAVIDWGGAPAELLTMRLTNDRVAEVQGLQFEVKRKEAEAGDQAALLDRVSDAVAIVDAQGRLLMVNASAERLFGRDRNAIVGESIGALLTPECQNAALGAVFAAGVAGPEAAETRLAVKGRRRECEPLPLRMTLRSLGAAKVGLVLRDESETEALRDDLNQLRTEVSQTGKIRSDFLAKVSHELRTPLNVIIGFAEIILGERFGPVGNPRYVDYITDIHVAGKHVIDLIADLLDLSTMQAGRHDLTLRPTDANRIVTDSVADLQAQASRDRVILRLSLLPQLPNAMVDERALRQVLDNILSNAIQFNEPGGQVIVSTAVTEGGGITVRVRDTGIGMSEAELAVAMEPFRQISTGRPGAGSGLGLPLARALVDANHATMAIRSRKGEGTLVEIVLPPASDQTVSVPAA